MKYKPTFLGLAKVLMPENGVVIFSSAFGDPKGSSEESIVFFWVVAVARR